MAYNGVVYLWCSAKGANTLLYAGIKKKLNAIATPEFGLK
jgi:hypothetical protein